MFEELFAKKKINLDRLIKYGFETTGKEYRYSCEIMQGDFLLAVIFDRNGNVETDLKESFSGEDYTLYKTDAQGSFIGRVREAITDVLTDIADKCFESSIFKFGQTMQLLAHARDTFGTDIEFPFKDHDTGILRRAETEKWYAAIITVPKSKLGIDSKQIVEIVNLHASKEDVAELLCRPNFYPAWHMNKKTWFTVILDGSVENEELFDLLDRSYRLAKK